MFNNRFMFELCLIIIIKLRVSEIINKAILDNSNTEKKGITIKEHIEAKEEYLLKNAIINHDITKIIPKI